MAPEAVAHAVHIGQEDQFFFRPGKAVAHATAI